MKLIDIDNIKVLNSHIHYRKVYEGSALLMNKQTEILRYKIKFSLEYSAVDEPRISVEFIEHPEYSVSGLIKKIIRKVKTMDSKGELSRLE